MTRRPLRFTPFHLAGAMFLLAGAGLAAYHGLEQFGLVPRFGWTSWTHIHFVTVGGFVQLLFGTVPQLNARVLDRSAPPRLYGRIGFVGLNGGFLLAWYGRAWGHVWAFDLGLVVVWTLVAGLLVSLLRSALRSDRGWNATTGLYLLSTFVFLWGLTYAWGLYGHVWQVPGGWLGLREAHVHANAWGFLGLAAVGTLYEVFPRVLGVDLYSHRLKNYSAVLFALGIGPLITGPWLDMGRTVTATGLLLYASGFVLYLYVLIRTYLAASERPGVATSVLVAQFWMLGPAGFAPVVLFGVQWVRPAFVEDGALHLFFVGWALPVAFAGLALYFRNLACPPWSRLDGVVDADPADLLPAGYVPSGPSRWTVLAWNLAVLVVAVGFFYQDRAWSAFLFGPGYAVLVTLWVVVVGRALRTRRTLRRRAAGASEGGG